MILHSDHILVIYMKRHTHSEYKIGDKDNEPLEHRDQHRDKDNELLEHGDQHKDKDNEPLEHGDQHRDKDNEPLEWR